MYKNSSNVVISFMGVDGSGKTTLINLVKKRLKNNFSKIRYVHLRPYFFLLDTRDIVIDPHKHKKKSFRVISFFKILYWLLVYRLYFMFLGLKKRELIIFDRYAHDLLIDKIRYEFNLSEKLSKLILNYFPKPNLWVHLEASIKNIENRKKELARAELQKQLKSYRYFFKNRGNTIKINTNYHPKKNLNLIISKIKSITT